jgi:hypothetical protein
VVIGAGRGEGGVIDTIYPSSEGFGWGMSMRCTVMKHSEWVPFSGFLFRPFFFFSK